MTLTLDLQVAVDDEYLPSEEEFQHFIHETLRAVEHQNPVEMTLRIVDNEEGKELNETYRHKTGPTNVLAFPYDIPEEVGSDLIGDIVICAPVVKREAEEQQKPLLSHWAHLTVHGTLHLLGYDHVDTQDALVMEALEIQILSTLGFPNPYENLTGVY